MRWLEAIKARREVETLEEAEDWGEEYPVANVLFLVLWLPIMIVTVILSPLLLLVSGQPAKPHGGVRSGPTNLSGR